MVSAVIHLVWPISDDFVLSRKLPHPFRNVKYVHKNELKKIENGATAFRCGSY